MRLVYPAAVHSLKHNSVCYEEVCQVSAFVQQAACIVSLI